MDAVEPARGGSVYRGVCTTIRAALDGDDDLAALMAGHAAHARNLAHQVDLASGHGGAKREPYAIPQLARELREVLAVLTGAAAAGTGTDDEALAALLQGRP